MTALAVLDAHALIWAATGQQRLLGRRARSFLERVEQGTAAAYVPTVALVEIGEAVWRGTVRFAPGFDAWLDGLLSCGRYHAVDLTVEIVRRAHAFHGIPERGDRLVAATAVELGCPVVSRDPALRAMTGVDVLW